MLSMLYPALADLFQPLGGEAAARRTVLEDVPFMQGWGVEVGLLVEVLEAYGAAAISQVDLGVRRHRHRPLGDLSLQASEILLTLMLRSGRVQLGDIDCRLHCAGGTSVELNVDVRPALSSIEIDER